MALTHREEKILEAVIDGSSVPFDPITRREKIFAKAAGEDIELAPPITKEEQILSALAAKGSGGGGSSIQTVEVTVVDDTDEARIALPLTILGQGALVTRIQQQPGVFNVVFTGDELIIVMDTTLNTARFSVAGNAEIRQNFGITAIAITGACTITFSDPKIKI